MGTRPQLRAGQAKPAEGVRCPASLLRNPSGGDGGLPTWMGLPWAVGPAQWRVAHCKGLRGRVSPPT